MQQTLHVRDAVLIRAHAARTMERCRQLAKITDVPGETTRTFLSSATHEAQALVTGWMEGAGLNVTIDRIGNLHGLRRVCDLHAPRLLLGSHLDTVVNAGAFDGPLGILLGLDCIELLGKDKLSFEIEIVAFSEEEGVRFRKPFLGSLALIGEPAPLTLADASGTSLEKAIADYSHTPTAPDLLAATTFGYVEFHIEQGPILETEQRGLAAVSRIAGQTRMHFVFKGQANHAGTTPMTMRRDALAAAAAWILKVEALALDTPNLVATVASIEAEPGLSNVIPSRVTATLDLRHADDGVRRRALDRLIEDATAVAGVRSIVCTSDCVLDQPAVPMDERLTEHLVAAAASCGLDASPIASGAGHDAMILARRVPAAMLFLRTPGGLSHCPDEAVLVEDVAAALATGLAFLRGLSPLKEAHAYSP